MKKAQKGVFFNGYEREDVVEYRKIFLNKMKSLLPYFVGFSNDGFMLPKIYLDDYAVERLDQKPIIMVIYDENIFLANSS